MSGRDWMQVLTLERGVLTSSSMSEHARVCRWSVPGNKSQPSSLLVYVAWAPGTQARPKSKLRIGNPCRSTCWALVSKWVSTDGSYTPSFGSAFIHNLYSPNVYWGALCEAWEGRETDHSAGLALKAAKLYERIIIVMRRACDNRGMYRNVWMQEK